ncbi:hypothetical protein BFF93_11835 [Elizabethkingia meningoseptica]|nr:hypothetical protein BES09_11825 [Elizabethkingia meningoseptica]OHT28390.1 hypothetical protein BFF93_11835 [Elizabethkingia meningoseptica]OPC01882.1 hypothetical protein BAS10_18215 [Elizabethkingia meningoseptica]OPC07535.1 hypothetical protein BAX93_16495 [Elizabethkingia meningoseptica]
MYKYCLIIFLLPFFSCKEKNRFKEIYVNENILNEIQKYRNNSKQKGIYVISLFTDKDENICEIVRYKEPPTSINFVGCQLRNSDTIFLYTDKKNKFLSCYRFSGRDLYTNKKQFVNREPKEVRYYKLDTLNCLMTKIISDTNNKNPH